MLRAAEMAWIRAALGLCEAESPFISRNPDSGLNNETYILRLDDGRAFLYRRAGEGTERFCDRRREAQNYALLAPYRLTDTLVACDPDTGAKLSVYHIGARSCDPNNPEDRSRAMAILRRLHALPVKLCGQDDPWQRLNRYEALAGAWGAAMPDGFKAVKNRLKAQGVDALTAQITPVPVHADALAANILFLPDGTTKLIDLEFAAMGQPFGDLADFVHDADLPTPVCRDVLREYLRRAPTEAEWRDYFGLCARVALMWSAWAACKARLTPAEHKFYESYAERSVRFAERMADEIN